MAEHFLQKEWESLLSTSGNSGHLPTSLPTDQIKRSLLRNGAVYVIGGSSNTRPSKSVHYFLPENSSWHKLPPLSRPKNHACSAIVQGHLYIIGGCDNLYVLNNVERLDLLTRTWSQGPRMMNRRSFASVAVLHNDIYIAGGCAKNMLYSNCPALQSMECFSTGLQQWRTLPAMVEPRALAVMTAMKDHLYISGGCKGCRHGDSVLSSMERFSPSGGVWTGLFPLLRKCIFGAQVVHGGYLYLCGGSAGNDCTNSAERFHHETSQWETLPPMKYARCGAVAVATQAGDIYVCGGCEKSEGSLVQNVAVVECFRSWRDGWETANTMFTNRSFPSAAVLGDHLYVLGGKDARGSVVTAAERLDLRDGMWQVLPPMPEGQVHGACSAYQPECQTR